MKYSRSQIYNQYRNESYLNENTLPALGIDLKSFNPIALIQKIRQMGKNRPAVIPTILLKIYKAPGGERIIKALKSALKLGTR